MCIPIAYLLCVPFTSWCTEHPLLWPHWRVLMHCPESHPGASTVLAINSQAPTQVFSKLGRVLVIQAETLACVLEMLSTDHPGNSCVARRWMSCALWCLPLHCSLDTVRGEQGCPMEMEGRMDRNSPTVLLAALFQCFTVQHLLNKT